MTLKIIGGQYRHRTLKTLPQDDLSIRPMLGRMKKSLFDILQTKIYGCMFLDLYAGVGSVGLEALSRGAQGAVFVEKSKTSAKLIKQNIDLLGVGDKAKIMIYDVIKNFTHITGVYDIIFMGPPYKDSGKSPLSLTYPTLVNVANSTLLSQDAIIISQRHKKERVDEVAGLEMFRSEDYGDTIIAFYKSTNK
jgi:16S rRNA (guanine(966)-N(2))-methyltransferase RsmD